VAGALLAIRLIHAGDVPGGAGRVRHRLAAATRGVEAERGAQRAARRADAPADARRREALRRRAALLDGRVRHVAGLREGAATSASGLGAPPPPPSPLPPPPPIALNIGSARGGRVRRHPRHRGDVAVRDGLHALPDLVRLRSEVVDGPRAWSTAPWT
jgi:hypothetical protein